MSHHQTNTSLVRTRSLRASARPPVSATQPTAPASSAHIPSTASHVSLFLTNLRLLDLDQEEDWPGITPSTFSAKDAAGGQKKRIHCVEWALYNLFVLWDENETRNKLKPFYPPLDQVQSINLRAALLRGLEQTKRNGVLGRDAVIRKTMLDECKGERFEEVLAVFSSAVLKKLVAERVLNSGPEYRPTISEKIALENYGYSGDRTELNGLLLAHKVSLAATLADKNDARERYGDFEDLLALKERNIARRKEQIKVASKPNGKDAVPTHLGKQARHVLTTNWTGDDQWLDSILHSDAGAGKSQLLATEFEDVWSGVRQGRLSDLEDKSAGLLEQLDQRVKAQRARLEKWEGFRKSIFDDKPPGSPGPEDKVKGQSGIDLGFTAHKKLQAGTVDPEYMAKFKLAAPPPEYAQLLDSIQAEFNDIGKPRVPDFSQLASACTTTRTTVDSLAIPRVATEPISDLSEWEDEPEEDVKVSSISEAPPRVGNGKVSTSQPPRLQSPKRRLIIRSQSVDEETTGEDGNTSDLPRRGRSLKVPVRLQKPTIELPPADSQELKEPELHNSDHDFPTDDEVLSPPTSPERLPRLRMESGPDPMPPSPRPISPTQAMADQILASMSNASPSPVKKPRHTLSLAERTRMSMTRTKSFEPEEEMDPTLLSPSPVTPMRSFNDSPSPGASITGEQYEDLVARTRRSMAGFEAAKQKAQMERRRSERKNKAVQRKDSYFPRVEEEMVGDTSVVEELLETPQADMEAIFKSRPKMRTSPGPSLSRRWSGAEEDEA
jgi:hypothetical protein